MKSIIHNNFFVYIVCIFAIGILLFVTRSAYDKFTLLQDEKATLQSDLQKYSTELKRLNELKSRVLPEDSEARKEIVPYMVEFNREDILEYIYDYAAKVNTPNKRMLISSISIGEPAVSDLGFRKTSIQLSVEFGGEKTLFSFLNYMTGDERKYKFYLENFSYPMNEASGSLSVTIPLTLYFK